VEIQIAIPDHILLGDQPFSSELVWLAYSVEELRCSGVLPMCAGLLNA